MLNVPTKTLGMTLNSEQIVISAPGEPVSRHSGCLPTAPADA